MLKDFLASNFIFFPLGYCHSKKIMYSNTLTCYQTKPCINGTPFCTFLGKCNIRKNKNICLDNSRIHSLPSYTSCAPLACQALAKLETLQAYQCTCSPNCRTNTTNLNQNPNLEGSGFSVPSFGLKTSYKTIWKGRVV